MRLLYVNTNDKNICMGRVCSITYYDMKAYVARGSYFLSLYIQSLVSIKLATRFDFTLRHAELRT